jgi:hypothetical protein
VQSYVCVVCSGVKREVHTYHVVDRRPRSIGGHPPGLRMRGRFQSATTVMSVTFYSPATCIGPFAQQLGLQVAPASGHG